VSDVAPRSLPGGGLLFTDPRFHDLNGVPPQRRWRYEHRVDGRLVGVLDGVLDDGVLLSGYSAPFGGPDLVRPDPSVDDVLGLVAGALERAREDGVDEVHLRARPPVYSATEPLLEYAYLHCGLQIAHCDLNQHLDLAAGGDHLAGMRERKRRYVRAALARPHELVPAEGDDDLDTCHAVIAANRAAHGRPAPLARDYLARAREAFPGRIEPLLLRIEDRTVAAAVVYRVLDDVDQVVHWADAADAGPRSPMELLAHLLAARSRERGARLLDLGPSTEKDGTPNAGLVAFKRSIGAVPGTRKVFTRRLA
jgi:hypothetical protein